MRVLKSHDANPQPPRPGLFTGEVHTQMLIDGAMAKQFSLNLVRFSAGSRTNWHIHSYEQGLIITEGKGIVATEAEEHVVEAGDVVFVVPGEKHWHGATDTTAMTHLAILTPGETTMLEPVEKIRTANPLA